jgi:dipeptidyl aminopeptidase/acylaminoacyl peptidase
MEHKDLVATSAPDGSRFALISTRGGSVNLWLVSADGRRFEALTQDAYGIMGASEAGRECVRFSPDGKNLAFIARHNLWVLGLADRQARSLTFDGGVRALCWNPAGDALAVVQNNDVRRVALDGSSNRLMVLGGATQADIAWGPSPQTSTLIFYMGQGVSQVDDALNTALVAPSTVEPNAMALFPNAIVLLAPAVSGGEVEAYSAAYAGGAKAVQITQGGASAVWASADGQSLYFMRDGILWSCNLDGSKARPLGASLMDHVNLGALEPVAGACP